MVKTELTNRTKTDFFSAAILLVSTETTVNHPPRSWVVFSIRQHSSVPVTIESRGVVSGDLNACRKKNTVSSWPWLMHCFCRRHTSQRSEAERHRVDGKVRGTATPDGDLGSNSSVNKVDSDSDAIDDGDKGQLEIRLTASSTQTMLLAAECRCSTGTPCGRNSFRKPLAVVDY